MNTTHPTPADMDPLLIDALPDLLLDELSQALASDQLSVELLADAPLALGPRFSDSHDDAASPEQKEVQASPVMQRAPMKNPSRERMKAELRLLRSRVADMEQQLQAAKKRETLRREVENWKADVTTQLNKRRRAEAENRSLRATLKQQINIACSLESVVAELRIDLEQFYNEELPRGTKRPRSHTSIPGLRGVDQLKELENEAARAYDLVDSVLQVCNLTEATVRNASMHAAVKTGVLGDQEQLVVELVDSKLVPFSLGRTSDALWHVLSGEAFNGHDIRLIDTSPTTIRVKSSYSWRAKGREKRVRVAIAFRRFTSAHRTVVTWRAITQHDLTTNSDSRAHHNGSDETGWLVIREVEAPTGDVGERACVLQIVSYHAPVWCWQAASAQEKQLEISEFKSMLLNSTEDDIASVSGAMETLLLADALHTVAAT